MSNRRDIILSQDEYISALQRSWNVPLAEDEWFTDDSIKKWMTKKCGELGVPLPYIAYPFLSLISYSLHVSTVKVSEKWKEPVILYTLVSGRSGTNKSGCLASIESVLSLMRNREVEEEAEIDEHESSNSSLDSNSKSGSSSKTVSNKIPSQVIFDTGTSEGLMSTLKANKGKLLCAVDEFSSFIETMESNAKGSGDGRARYLSLWSAAPWRKNTKQAGLEEIQNPRFHFAGFNQNYFLINMVVNGSNYDGFLPRFLIATPREVFAPFMDKIDTANKEDELDICEVIGNIYDTYTDGCEFEFNQEAIKAVATYHDDFVLEERQKDLFEDTKCAVLSKSVSNVIRISAVQCALRNTVSAKRGEVFDIGVICEEDVKAAIAIVKYSFNCVTSLLESTAYARPNSVAKKRKRETVMPTAEAIDREFIKHHKKKVLKMYDEQQKTGTNIILVSKITKNHWYPQLGGDSGSDTAVTFLKGLEANNLGRLVTTVLSEHKFFEMINLKELENIPEEDLEFLRELGVRIN